MVLEFFSGGGVNNCNGNIGDDPCFVDSANDDYHIQPISPCVDVGDPCGTYSGQTDIDGDDRVIDIGGIDDGNVDVDMGADEFNGVIYVDADATSGNDNGGSWANAYLDLQDALDAAGSGVEIWVAEGTYYPTDGTTRTISFELISGVDVYGGFDPCSGDDLWSERDWAGNVTILSGDIDDQGTNDSYNVVVGATGATLDGFTITMGYADHASTFQYQCGGGMWNEDVSPTITNCIFMDNEAYFGGGMFNDSASPTIKNCIFADNTARTADVGIAGAIFCYDYSDAAIENCTITQNTSDYVGGGIVANSYSDPQISNSIIVYNQDSFGYSDIDAYGSSAVIVNYSDYGILYADGATITPQNCISVAPEFADAGNDDFHLKAPAGRWNGSSWVTTDLVISPCIDTGDPCSVYSNERSPNGSRINMGVYGNTTKASKSNTYIFVSKTSGSDSTGNGISTNPYATIQKGIDMVGDGGTVTVVDSQTYNERFSFTSTWDKDFTLTTGSATIDGQDGGRVFYFSSVSSSITVEMFTIEDGKAVTGGGAYIYNSNNITFDDCDFESNDAYNDSGAAAGGALFILSCTPSISNCNFVGNNADGSTGSYGGAIYTYESEASIDSCTIGTNYAPLSISDSAEVYTDNGDRPTFSNCGIRGGWLGDYMDWAVLPPNNGGGNYSL